MVALLVTWSHSEDFLGRLHELSGRGARVAAERTAARSWRYSSVHEYSFIFYLLVAIKTF